MANAVYTLSSATVLGGPSAGGGDVADALSSGASLDGVFSFKEVSAPSGTADYAKVYAKDTGADAEILYHFTGNVNDSSGESRNATNTNCTFELSTAFGYLTEGTVHQRLEFPNAGGDSGSAFLSVPDPAIGTSACTIEFFFTADTNNTGHYIFNDGYGTWGNLSLHLRYDGDNTNRHFRLFQSNDNGSSFEYYNTARSDAGGADWYSGSDDLKHIAIVRAAASGGNSQWRIYYDGNYIAPADGDGTPIGNWTTLDIGGQAHIIGKAPNYPDHDYWFNGKMAEFRITKAELYTGTSTYTVPSVPLPNSGATELYAQDSAGNSTQLT